MKTMATKKTSKTYDCPAQSYSSLERAIGELSENMSRLTARLVGDEKLQTQGLIGEFTSVKTRMDDQESTSARTAELLNKLEARMELHEKNSKETNNEVHALKDRVDSVANQFAGGWKTVTVICSIVVGAGGFLAWILTAWLTAQPYPGSWLCDTNHSA